MGIRKAYYSDNREDAVIMTTDAIHTPKYLDMFQGQVATFSQRRGEAVRTLA